MTYQEQLDIIKAIPIKEGDTKVITCPFCYGEKKLALSKLDGKLLWYCYRASCNGKGVHHGNRGKQSVKDYLSNVKRDRSNGRPIPEIVTAIENHPPAIEYLKSVNSLEAHQNKWIKVKYAPAEDRVLFYNEGSHGAVGRALSKYGPKWISYGKLPDGISVGVGNIAVLVEDTPSACSVSRVDGLVGIALLGTTITSGIKKTLNNYPERYLVLDKDAALKSISQMRRIDKSLKTRLTKVDLKHMSTDLICQLIEGE